MKTVMAAAALVALGGCATMDSGPASGGRYAAGHFRSEAVLHDAGGTTMGKAVVEQVGILGTASNIPALRMTIDVTGMTPGLHGVHVHMVGKCEPPDFATAGGHWNPTAHQHGSMNPAGPHAGDLPNLDVGADGRGHLEFTLMHATYEGLLDEDGAAVVVHAKPDDLATDPSGNSGGRVACGVVAAL
ncbi:MAG: superoxide dismutase family protein [Pseudomonadota bacterium]